MRSCLLGGALAALACATPTAAPAPAPATPQHLVVEVGEEVGDFDGFAIPAPTGQEAALFEDAADGVLDRFSVLQAVLIASGVARDDLPREAARVQAALAPAIDRARTEPTAFRRGQALLEAMHGTVLRRYALFASDVPTAVRTGSFDCVSSSILYLIAVAGLVEAPRCVVSDLHVFIRVRVDGRDVDVETTSPQGCAPDRAKVGVDAEALARFAPELPVEQIRRMLADSEETPPLSLVAAVYNNRAVTALGAGDTRGGVTLADRAARLATGRFRSRLLDLRAVTLNNGALQLLRRDKLDDARVLLEIAHQGATGDTERLVRHNLAETHARLGDQAATQRDFARALEEYQRAVGLGDDRVEILRAQAAVRQQLAVAEGSARQCQADGLSAADTAAMAAAECLAELSRSLTASDVDRALQLARWAEALAPGHPPCRAATLAALVERARRAQEALDCDAVELLLREANGYLDVARSASLSPATFTGQCWARRALKAFEREDWDGAIELLRRARALVPEREDVHANLASALFNQALAFSAQGRCDDARARLWDVAQGSGALDDEATAVLAECAQRRALEAASKQDWERAAIEARLGLLDTPADPLLRKNLAIFVHNHVVSLLRAERCEAALGLVPTLREVGEDALADAATSACKKQ